MPHFDKIKPGHYENDDYVILRYTESPPFWGLLRKHRRGLTFVCGFPLLCLAKRHVEKIYTAICEMEA